MCINGTKTTLRGMSLCSGWGGSVSYLLLAWEVPTRSSTAPRCGSGEISPGGLEGSCLVGSLVNLLPGAGCGLEGKARPRISNQRCKRCSFSTSACFPLPSPELRSGWGTGFHLLAKRRVQLSLGLHIIIIAKCLFKPLYMSGHAGKPC